MVITMNDSKLSSIVEVKRFLKESDVIEFKKRFRKEAYEWIEETLERFDYLNLCKKEKGLIKKYIFRRILSLMYHNYLLSTKDYIFYIYLEFYQG